VGPRACWDALEKNNSLPCWELHLEKSQVNVMSSEWDFCFLNVVITWLVSSRRTLVLKNVYWERDSEVSQVSCATVACKRCLE
jgi:hypothetical protein